MAAPQYHFQFPSDFEALRFARVVAWKMRDVALCREGAWVTVVDGAGGREQELLAIAVRVQADDLPAPQAPGLPPLGPGRRG